MHKKTKKNEFVFTMDIKSARNHTWQGTLFCAQKKKEVPFRSALELIRLLDSAIDLEEDGEEENPS